MESLACIHKQTHETCNHAFSKPVSPEGAPKFVRMCQMFSHPGKAYEDYMIMIAICH